MLKLCDSLVSICAGAAVIFLNRNNMANDVFNKQIVKALNFCDDVESLYLKISKIYEEIQLSQPWLEPFTVKIDKTINHLEFYYYCVDTHLENCVVISTRNEYGFIFGDSHRWNLCDDYNMSNAKIAELLMSWRCFSMPSKVIKVKNLILEGYWKFDLNIVPKLSLDIPLDTQELISWDDKCVLNGTNKDNLCVISRKEWNKIINNENKLSE